MVYVCMVYVYTCRSQREKLSSLLYHFPSYSLKTGSLTGSRIRLVVHKAQQSIQPRQCKYHLRVSSLPELSSTVQFPPQKGSIALFLHFHFSWGRLLQCCHMQSSSFLPIFLTSVLNDKFLPCLFIALKPRKVPDIECDQLRWNNGQANHIHTQPHHSYILI